MTLEQLRIFIAVAEREHMTAAAQALHVTQSAASTAISTLEERHYVKLFHRVGRGITLTEAGRLFLDEARGVLARARAAELMLDEMGALKRGSLRVVASQTTAAYWLPPMLADFSARYPLIDTQVVIGNTDQAAASVHDGSADLGIVEGDIENPALAHWPIGEDRLVLVQAAPFKGAVIDAAWLRSARWIMREQGSGTRSTLEQALRRLGIDARALKVALTLPSNESVRTAVEAGHGIAALSTFVVAPSIAAGFLHELPCDFGRRSFFAVRHKERFHSKASAAFLELIDELARS
jgi:DNA-binding transcriptional LysR family regulator